MWSNPLHVNYLSLWWNLDSTLLHKILMNNLHLFVCKTLITSTDQEFWKSTNFNNNKGIIDSFCFEDGDVSASPINKEHYWAMTQMAWFNQRKLNGILLVPERFQSKEATSLDFFGVKVMRKIYTTKPCCLKKVKDI